MNTYLEPGHPDGASGDQMIDTFSQITGADISKARLIHPRGYWFSGTFQGAQQRPLTDSIIFDGRSWPLVVRFSGTLGGPNGHDAQTGDQGFGLRVQAEDKRSFDLMAFTLPVFFVRRAVDMADFFTATAPDPETGAPDSRRVEEYLKKHPESVTALSLGAQEPPETLAGLTYNAVHAFGLTADGELTWARFVVEPDMLSSTRLSMLEAMKLPRNYLQLDLQSRLPVSFTVFAQLPVDGDPVHDPTQLWSNKGERIKMATITIENTIADNEIVHGFDPLNIDTLAPPTDQLIADRHRLYLAAQRRRRK
ncbi:catalase [Mycobacteroides abscessus]